MIRTLFARVAAAIVLAGAAMPAQAAWREASSDHFVVYSDASEEDIGRFAQMLERYRSAMEFVTSTTLEKPSPSNRLTVYVVNREKQVQQLYGTKSSVIKGFYVPSAGRSVAVVSDEDEWRGGAPISFATFTLLHEYAHHFTLSTSAFSWPRWMSEGAAEFFSSAKFEKDGSVWLGRPNPYRGSEIIYALQVPIEQLIDPELYAKGVGANPLYDNFYGQSWLLYHYLVFEPVRKGQLREFQRRIASGEAQLDAARAVFGDLNALKRDLVAYQKRRKLTAMYISADKLQTGPIAVRALGPGEAAAMPVVIRSHVGVDEATAKTNAAAAREVAKDFPGDPAVNAALAEAELGAGNEVAAIAAADKAIAADPSRRNAYVQKGLALMSVAGKADSASRAAAFAEARKPFVALNRLENDHPLPLIYFYRSLVSEGKDPTDLAKQGLQRASELAPFDNALHLELAQIYLRDGKLDFARFHLRPVASAPHGASAVAAKILKGIEDGSITAKNYDPAIFAQAEAEEKKTETPGG